MPRHAARSGPDFALADSTGVMLTWDGRAVLSSRNAWPNPDLKDFDDRGVLEEWTRLGAPPSPDGWSWGASGPDFPILTKQNASTLPMERTSVVGNQPLVAGALPQDAAHRAKVAPPGRPLVEVIALARPGYKAGWVGVELCWIVGNPAIWPRRRFTQPGPRAVVQISQGQCVAVDLANAGTPPEGVTGIGIGQTQSQATENAARTATARFQRALDIRRGVPAAYNLTGEYRAQTEAPTRNETYIGGRGGPYSKTPFYTIIRGDWDLEEMKGLRLAFLFRTRFGSSAAQGVTPAFDVAAKKLMALAVKPYSLPYDAISWTLLFTAPDGSWYAGSQIAPGKHASLYTNDPEKFPPAQRSKLQSLTLPDEDLTGVPGPDEEIAGLTAFGAAVPKPGRYRIRTWWNMDDDDGTEDESAPSPPVTVDIAQGQTFRVHRPPAANNLANPQFVERDPEDEQPGQWTRPPGTGVTHRPGDGEHAVDDQTGSNADQDVNLSRPHLHDGISPVVHRFVVDVQNWASGKVQAILRQTKADGTTLDTVVREFAGNLSDEIEHSIGPAGSGADTVQASNVVSSRIVQRHVGSSASGTRRFTATLRNPASMPGLAAARKRWPRSPAAGAEKTADPYPPGGYMVVVEDPPDPQRPADLRGLSLNMFEYWGPYQTPMSAEYGPAGLKLPVKPGETVCPSFYVMWKGVTTGCVPIRLVVKDRFGRTVQQAPSPQTNVAAVGISGGWRRVYSSFVADPRAAYIEVEGSSYGDGLVRLMGFQLDRGRTTPTAFTPRNGTSGEIVSYLDTRVPGVKPKTYLANLNRKKRWVRGGAVTDDVLRPVTAVVVDFSAKDEDEASWSPWVTSVAQLPLKDLVRVRAKLSTTDATQSPEVSELFVQSERYQPVLLRDDGSEYEGGCQVTGLFLPFDSEPVQTREFADRSRGFRVMGDALRLVEGFGLECYSRRTADEIRSSQGRGEGCVVAEVGGVRYRLRAFNIAFSGDEEARFRRERYVKDDADPDGWYKIEADGIEALVVAESAL
jgi:hypothetical protein